jgi:hypothetical protein
MGGLGPPGVARANGVRAPLSGVGAAAVGCGARVGGAGGALGWQALASRSSAAVSQRKRTLWLDAFR